MAAMTHVVLRDDRQARDTRYLEAQLTQSGDLIIKGQDIGDAVERLLGGREYEWAWTIKAAHLPQLLKALNADSDVLAALARRFSGDAAAGIATFLEENEIPHERWSRVGD